MGRDEERNECEVAVSASGEQEHGRAGLRYQEVLNDYVLGS